jgi:hypothetical protein
MNQRHFTRGKQEIAADVSRADAGDARGGPERDAKIRLPSFLAELAPPDFQRLLAAKILRLLVGQDFLGISLRLDDS